MFCLRSWLLPLLILSNSPPIYLLLFILATYILQRPCLYCTLLLFLIVVTLFDFKNRDWFGDDYLAHFSTDEQAQGLSSESSIPGTLGAAASVVGAAVNQTVGMVAEVVGQEVQRRLGAGVGSAGWSVGRIGWVEWLKDLNARGLRIGCLNAVVRL